MGEECLLCGQGVVEGESGIVMGYVDAQGNGGLAPQHIECFLRSTVGSVAHLERGCTCFGGTTPEQDRHSRNYRAQARETMEWLIRHGH